MNCKRLLSLLVQAIIALVAFAAITRAQTVSTAKQSAVTNAATGSQQDTDQTESLVEPQNTDVSNIASRKQFVTPAKFEFVNEAFSFSKVGRKTHGESTEPQEPKPAAHAASNGTNPAELITRIEVKYQYQNFASGDLHGIVIIRGDYALTPKVAFRMDLPILHFDSQTPGLRSESGIGDIVTSMTFVKIFSRRFVGAVVPRIDFPTATHDSLGSGKYSFKPVVAGVTPVAKGVALVGVLEYRVSFAGNRNRADINEMSLKPILLKSFLEGPLKGYYVNPQAEIIVDFENNNRTTLQLAANMGKTLNKNVVVFVVPTIHVAGTKRESFKLEVGFRYLFR